MEIKFIEGTNQQYSIREDGVVFRNYRHNYNINTKKIDIIKHLCYIVKPYKVSEKCNTVSINKKSSISVNVLLKNNFGFTLCSKCDCKIYNQSTNKRTRNICDNCQARNTKNYHKPSIKKEKILLTIEQKKINLVKSRLKWIINNPDKNRNGINKRNLKRNTNLPKYEIAFRLKIPNTILTNDLYQEKKELLLFKRQLAKTHNISINSIK
jgi:hypothetical protein